MTDLITETEEAMRRERLEEFWHDHKLKIISLLIAIVIATGVISGYDHWNTQQNIKSTNTMLAFMEDETFPQNVTAETSLDMRPGVKALLLLNAAGAYEEKDNTAQSIALYEKIIAEKSTPPALRDLAIISKVRLQSTEENPDIVTLQSALKPLTDNEKSAYRPLALIESAALSAKLSEYDSAIALLDKIKDMPNLPETLYLKAQSLSHVYQLKKASQTNEG